MRELHVYDEGIDIWRALEERWRLLARRAIDEKGFFTVALSGGRTPVGFYCFLSRIKGLPWSETELFQVDERQVPPGSEESNFRMIRSSLLEGGQVRPRGIHSVRTDTGDAADSALEYEKELRAFFGGTGGWPAFDLVLLGIGADSHTASLFPGGSELAEKKRWVVASRPEKAAHQRVTITLPVINTAGNVVLVATGGGKAKAVRSLWEGGADPSRPASLVRPGKGVLAIYVDRQAGACR